jgi:hypothetical protein
MKVIKVLVALIMGFFSAFLISMAANLLFYAPISQGIDSESRTRGLLELRSSWSSF